MMEGLLGLAMGIYLGHIITYERLKYLREKKKEMKQ